MRTFRKAVVIACIAAAGGCILLLIGLSQYYYSARPREPHPEVGRIYVERVKGRDGVADVYLTRLERLPFDYAPVLQSTSIVFALAAFLLNQRWKVISAPSYTPPKKFY
jgi:hypothetical protein